MPWRASASDAGSSSEDVARPGRGVDHVAVRVEHLRERLTGGVQRRLPGLGRDDRGGVSGSRGEAVVDRVVEVVGHEHAERDPGPRQQHRHHARERERELEPQRHPSHQLGHPPSRVVGPLERGEICLRELGRIARLGEVALLVAQHGPERAAERAFEAQQRPGDLVGEGQGLEHLLHVRVQERVRDREQTNRKEPVALLLAHAAAEQLAHPPAQQRQGDQLVGRLRDRGERDHGRPAADRARAEQRQRLANGVDLAREREERRVDVPQQPDREADVGADDPLELLERGVGRGQLAQGLQRGDRAGAAAFAARAGEELALEVREAEQPAAGELVAGGDAGRDQLEPARGGLGDQRPQLVVVASGHAELDDPAVLEQLGGAVELVQREREPLRLQRGRPLRGRGRSQLENRAGAVELRRRRAFQRDPDRAAGAELEQRGGSEAREHVTVADQLVGDHLAEAVDHRRAHDGDAGQRLGGRRGGEVAIDPLPAAAGAHGTRVDRPPAAVGVLAAQHAGPADRLVVGVGEIGQRHADQVVAAEQRRARGAREPQRARLVDGPQPVLGGVDRVAVRGQPVDLIPQLGDLGPQRLALRRQPRALGLDGVALRPQPAAARPPRPRRPRPGPPPARPPGSRRQWCHSIQTLVACTHAARRATIVTVFLVYRDLDHGEQLHELQAAAPRVTIGRRPSSDVALPWDDEVSRVHAELRPHGQRVGRPRRRALPQRDVRQRRARPRPAPAARRGRDPGGTHADHVVRGRARVDGGADARRASRRADGGAAHAGAAAAARGALPPAARVRVPRAGVQPRARGRAADLARHRQGHAHDAVRALRADRACRRTEAHRARARRR